MTPAIRARIDRIIARPGSSLVSADALWRLWEMNPHIDPRNEFENTIEGIRYFHMKEHPEVYRGAE